MFLQAKRHALKTSQNGPETATDLFLSVSVSYVLNKQKIRNEKDEETRARRRRGGGGGGGGEASLK